MDRFGSTHLFIELRNYLHICIYCGGITFIHVLENYIFYTISSVLFNAKLTINRRKTRIAFRFFCCFFCSFL